MNQGAGMGAASVEGIREPTLTARVMRARIEGRMMWMSEIEVMIREGGGDGEIEWRGRMNTQCLEAYCEGRDVRRR